MPAQYWESLLNAPALGAGAAYASSAVIADVNPTPNFVLPANFLQVGSVLRITASGVFSNTGTPTLILGAYYGGVAGTALGATTAITTITAASNWPWKFYWEGVVRTVGPSGTIIGVGHVLMPASITQFQAPWCVPATGAQTAVTIDTTSAKAITLGATWSASSASNTLTVNNFLVESVA